MKYHKGTRRKPLEYEKDLVQFWRENKTFEKSVEQRSADQSYVFYDGPPFITGEPHYGTLLSSIVKDTVPRYQTMQGKRVERVWGWDCHGLPAEVFTEKKLGITQKAQVYDIGLEKYITTCRDNMVQTGSLWEDTIDRIGRWVDFKGAYKTMDKEYMESVWWAFKTLYDKGKIYEGERVLMYCTKDATPLSKAEVTMDGNAYKDVTDPSVYIKFKLKDQDIYLLAWTTTPWTLPANAALAVNKEIQYVLVEYLGQKIVVAKDLVSKVFVNDKKEALEYNVVKDISVSDLLGKEYEPILDADSKIKRQIWQADFVSLEEGTGIVHIAPAYGEDDFELANKNGIPVIHAIDANGLYSAGKWQGQLIWDVNKEIAKYLVETGVALKIDYIRHSYPHCHRCDNKLIYRAHPSWFMDIESQKQEMLEQNGESINWFPNHIKEGRFAKNIEAAPDWNLSRDRFWATAMPVWKGIDKSGKEHIKVIGSYAELKELSGVELDDYHRPWIDDVTFEIDGVKYQRIDKVLDCWFESGSMPFAQFHYPFENVKKFEESFPGDFISEYISQVRAWFYYLHAISIGLFGKSAFKNVIVTGTLAGNDGRKMSKSYGNFTNPNILMDQYGADSLRFLLLQSPILSGEDFSLIDKDVSDVARKLGMIWNIYDFFTLYAEVDQWEWQENEVFSQDELSNILDIWIVARLHQLQAEIEKNMDNYDIPNALKPVLPFIDDASNWFVRRSRKRFWKSDNDNDKQDAYKTLHYVLVRLSLLLAPFTPFLAEELYRKMTGGESVHLLDWPKNGHINEVTIARMAVIRDLITDGLAQRAAAKIKVRQPLSRAVISLENEIPTSEWADYEQILLEELNVKEISLVIDKKDSIELDLNISDELKREGLSRELIRQIQESRKKANLDIDERIILYLSTEDKELAKAIDEHSEDISRETLSLSLNQKEPLKTVDFKGTVNIDEAKLELEIQKAK